jgi:hypothetical protein
MENADSPNRPVRVSRAFRAGSGEFFHSGRNACRSGRRKEIISKIFIKYSSIIKAFPL